MIFLSKIKIRYNWNATEFSHFEFMDLRSLFCLQQNYFYQIYPCKCKGKTYFLLSQFMKLTCKTYRVQYVTHFYDYLKYSKLKWQSHVIERLQEFRLTHYHTPKYSPSAVWDVTTITSLRFSMPKPKKLVLSNDNRYSDR